MNGLKSSDFASLSYGTPLGSGSLYGSQRPTFSEDGKGMPYSSLLNMVGASVVNQDISYDTSSKDPVMIRSRVFIGNIVRGPITRDDLIELFKPFGKLLALTFFKGFAFVQFSEGYEADAACSALNGKRWKGAIIDVHLAMTGPAKNKKHDTFESSSRKRRYDDYDRDTKYPRADDAALVDETAEQNKRNRDVALADATSNDDLVDNGMADTLICGGCRFVTCDFEAFKDHRIAGCRSKKEEGEPERMKCASCDQRFQSAWALMCHLTDFHRMMLYKIETPVKSEPVNDTTSPIKQKAVTPPPFFTPVDKPNAASLSDTVDVPASVHVPTSSESAPNSEIAAAPQFNPIGTAASVVAPIPDGPVSATVSIAPPPSSQQQWTPLTGQTIPGLAGLSVMPTQQSYQQISPIGQGIPILGTSGYGKRI